MNIEKIKSELIDEIEKQIKIIKNEYKDLINIEKSYNLKKQVHIMNTGTVSLFVKNKNFYFPLDAVTALEKLKKIPGFGINKNHKTHTNKNVILNNNTYLSYIKHAYLKGLTPIMYYKEILLHETFHFCGSGGGSALREGINELKTRQLAQKYNLLTSSCGYPKEVKIAYQLEQVLKEDTINKIAFSKNDEEIKNILNKISPEAVKLYFNLEKSMNEEFYHKYMKYNYPGFLGMFKKTIKYHNINYKKAQKILENYIKNKEI